MTGRAAGALTLPWRGRIGARSAPGWGELRSKRRKKIPPHPTAFAARKRSTSPLQGEVKRASGTAHCYCLQIVADSDAGGRTAVGMKARAMGLIVIACRRLLIHGTA